MAKKEKTLTPPSLENLKKNRPKKLSKTTSRQHKVRSVWFQQRTAWPYREPSVEHLIGERARVRRDLADAPGTAQWEMIGPTNIGGRVTSVACHPTNADLVWIGAAGGGVWKTTDAGRTWRALWHQQATLNIGSLAVDPANANTLYCGTGEANLSADSYAGVGLFRSLDAGETWLLLAPAASTNLPTRIGAIAIDPSNPQHLRVGGIGFNGTIQSGMWVSTDGGTSWARENFVSSANYWCHAIAFNPADPNILYTAVSAQGSKSGIWRSKDNGRTWKHLTGGLPAPALFSRTSLALAPSNPKVIYAQACRAQSDAVLGIFRSTDGGETWNDVMNAAHFAGERQMSYNNTIVVHPADPDHVLCGGVDLHLTTNGGTTWKKVTDWRKNPGDPKYAHADHHALLMPASLPGRVVDVNDGGVDVSDDGGKTWANRSKGLSICMSYDVDVGQSNSNYFGGGLQDNGTPITTTGASDAFFDITGGDGGWIIFDHNDENHVFASIYNLNVFRYRGSQFADISPPATVGEKEQIWMCFLEVSPEDPKTLFAGGLRVWRTTNDGQSWTAVSDVLDNSPISALAIAPTDANRIYVGTENGAFFRSDDGGDTWSADLSGSVPNRIITRIDCQPDHPDVVVLSLGNTGDSHVFLSRDGGHSWTDIDQGNLPDVPHHALLIPPDAPQHIYVGNDAGVFVSKDLGQNWQSLTRNLPNIMVVDLVYHDADGTLTAATYGRSHWRIKIK